MIMMSAICERLEANPEKGVSHVAEYSESM